jgi:hypothetical protein
MILEPNIVLKYDGKIVPTSNCQPRFSSLECKVRFAVQASPHHTHAVRRLRSLAQAGAANAARFAPDCTGGVPRLEFLS